MKRIIAVEIDNYRAFYGKYAPIQMPRAENVLVYGENGSGKSSLYKALFNYFASSRNNRILFNGNHHSVPPDGSIRITFSEVDAIDREPIIGTEQILEYGSLHSDHSVGFVQDTELIKGFLDYRKLLDVYHYKEARPNLFGLIVEELLQNHIQAGGINGIGKRWISLVDDLYNVRSKRDKKHQTALAGLTPFEQILRIELDKIFLRVNLLLMKYFRLNLRIWYTLQPIVYNYDRASWHPTADLRLDIKSNGVVIDHHGDILNEARLSAMAVCLYLSSLLENPQGIDYKILFLDDVFIGLDAGNRIPILNILQNEFKEYQIFITTYDRNWYEVAQRYFEGHAPKRWRHFELYVTPELVGMRTIDKPIILPRQEEYDRAVYHLHHRSRPDYPAAANYFRKYAEHILSNFMPPQEIRNEDYSLVESYRLGKYVNEAQRFMRNIGANDTFLTRLEYLLPTLLHPLSHFEITSNVYKAELVEIQQLLVKIEAQLSSIKDGYRLIIPQGRMVKLGFAIAANSTGYYDVFAKESVYLLRDSGGRLTLSKAQCHSKATYIVTNGVEVSRQKFANGDPAKDYSSIENAYDVIYRFINAQAQYSHIAKAATYKTEFTFVDKGISQSLDGWMNSIQW